MRLLLSLRVAVVAAVVWTAGKHEGFAAVGSRTVLSRVVVDESRKWRYIGHRDFEILADTADAEASAFAAELAGVLRVLDALMPASARQRTSEPLIFVLNPNRVGLGKAQRPLFLRTSYADEDSFVGDLRFAEGSSQSTNLNSLGRDRGQATRFMLRAFLPYMMKRAVPAPELWVMRTFAQFLNTVWIDGARIQLDALAFASADGKVPALASFPEMMRMLGQVLPLPPRGLTPEQQRVADTARLFVRWALFANGGENRDRYWEFYRRSALSPRAGEALFQECFGLNYAGVQARLELFRAEAAEDAVVDLGLVLEPPARATEVRGAYPEEILRLNGEWWRLAADALPEKRNELVREAEVVFRKGLMTTAGQTDPRMWAAAGIFFAQTGRDAEALPLLGKAFAAGVSRASAHAELARIRLGQSGRLSAEEVARVLEPLERAYRQLPGLERGHELRASVWERTEVEPRREDLAPLLEGTKLFPLNTGLMLRTAMLYAAQGFMPEVKLICLAAFRVTRDPVQWAEFAELMRGANAGVSEAAGPTDLE